jgi:regulatory protein
MTTLREKAIDYLSRREHSRLELKQKLQRKAFLDSDIEAELDFLASKNLQDDARFAQAYVRLRKNAGFGPKRIKMELLERGIDRSLIDEVVDVRSSEWDAMMRSVWRRKFPSASKNQAQQFRFLLHRGYTSEAITTLFRTKNTDLNYAIHDDE